MNILHIAPHLGGGVGKAHAALAESAAATRSRDGVTARHSYALLEPPRDLDFVQRIRAAGCDVHVESDLDALAARAADADIVQIEWWNHPRLYHALVTNKLPAMRVAAWLHISGLVPPLVPRPLVDLLDHVFFTSPCSFGAANLRDAIFDRPHAFEVANSGFGFARVARAPRPADAPLRFGYLGTLDFLKMHPAFFDFIDAAPRDIHVRLWGHHDPDGEVARRAAMMRHPHRVSFAGFAHDPQAVLSDLDVFVYLLSPGHYGTGENALVEAMSAGAVPIVFANPAESYIVKNRRTGYIVESSAEFAALIAALIDDPRQLATLRATAMQATARTHSPTASRAIFEATYADLMRQPKRRRDFATALGHDARSWFLSSLDAIDADAPIGARLLSHVAAKGSLGHFRACFPRDESLEMLERRTG